MITGTHILIYTSNPEADRAFFRDVLDFRAVDVGHGWLIFALPASEIAVHPSEENDRHEFFLMCDDVEAEIRRLGTHGVTCEPVSNPGWGRLTRIRLPGGGTLGLYEPRHARP